MDVPVQLFLLIAHVPLHPEDADMTNVLYNSSRHTSLLCLIMQQFSFPGIMIQCKDER